MPDNEVVLRPRGWSRYVEAVFLAVWLCGWMVGEAFALWFLGAGAWALCTGSRLEHQPATVAGGLLVGGFLLGWLAFWSLGGMAAGYQFLRTLWGEDRLKLESGGLRVRRHAGPLRKERFFPREEIVAFYRNDGRALMAELQRRSVELTSLADAPTLERLLGDLRAWLGSPPADQAAAAGWLLPESWAEVPVPEGGTVLTGSPQHRRNAARVLGALGILCAAGAVLIWRDAAETGARGAVMIAGGLALLFGVWAWWARTSRREWKIEPGRITLQRRIGTRVKSLFSGRRLETTLSRDSDGDVWYKLVLSDESPDWKYGAKKSSTRTISRQINDPWEPRRLGRWIAQRSGLPLHEN